MERALSLSRAWLLSRARLHVTRVLTGRLLRRLIRRSQKVKVLCFPNVMKQLYYEQCAYGSYVSRMLLQSSLY